jgi:hypothetical protein
LAKRGFLQREVWRSFGDCSRVNNTTTKPIVYDDWRAMHRSGSHYSSMEYEQHKNPAALNVAFGHETLASHGSAEHRQQIGRIDELEILATYR